MPTTGATGTTQNPSPERSICFRGKFLEDMTKEELIICAIYSADRIKALEERNHELSRSQFDAFR
jgi:hypothetical protein